ncbi:MAG: CvpA family protein [Halanaerobiales bacterium]
MDFTLIDIIILVMVLYFAIVGYKKGFVRQTSMILGIVFAMVISMNYYNDFIPVVETYIYVGDNTRLMQFISFAILFIAINIFVHALGYMAKKILDALFLKPVDHAAGAALGLAEGFIVSYLLVLMLSYIPHVSVTDHISESILATRILDMTPFLQSSLQNIFSR